MPKLMIKADKKEVYQIVCVECGKVNDENITQTYCVKCKGVLEAKFNYDLIAERLNKYDLKNTRPSVLKYLDFYPIHDFRNAISLQEGGTQLYKAEKLASKTGFGMVYLKNEGANPTGVFKDRGTVVEVAKAREIGAKAVILASSGNMAASVAAYAAKAGLPCHVLIPENTPLGKMAQIHSYGAHVVRIRGEYSDCVTLVQKLSVVYKLYLAGDYVFRREGQKSIAFEIIEQMGFRSPDIVVCPVGAGTNIAGIWKGFVEYKRLKLIKKLPVMIGVQAEGAAVLVEAYKKKISKYKKWDSTNTICSAVAVANPVDGNLALSAIRDSEGSLIAVSDAEALKAQKYLASHEGLFVEPSSALAIAALEQLGLKGLKKSACEVVCVETGNGLKDPMSAMKNVKESPVFSPDYKIVSEYFKNILNKQGSMSMK